MSAGSQWRIGADVRSRDLGAAAVFDAAVDWDDVPAFPVIGLVRVLGTWVWLEGRDIAWWLGAVVQARSAASAAERVASAIAEHTGALRSRTMTLNVTPSTAQTVEEWVAEEELDLHDMPGSAEPYTVPVRAQDYARNGSRLTIGWSSGNEPLAHVSVSVTESLAVALFEHRPPLTGPLASADPMTKAGRHVVVDVGDVPAGLPVLDCYAGEYMSERESVGSSSSKLTSITAFVYIGEDA